MKVEKTVDLADGKPRCPWMFKVPEYLPYHDHEWGVPNHDDRVHFEFLVMENFQAGLSWAAVFRKRENYRKVFAGFDPIKVARFSEAKIDKLVRDARALFATGKKLKRW